MVCIPDNGRELDDPVDEEALADPDDEGASAVVRDASLLRFSLRFFFNVFFRSFLMLADGSRNPKFKDTSVNTLGVAGGVFFFGIRPSRTDD